MAITARARPPTCVLQMPSCSSFSIFLPSSKVTHRKRGREKDILYRIPSYRMNQFDLFFTLSASFGSTGRVPSMRHAPMGFVYVELLSSHSTSCGSMLLSIRVSHLIFLGFPSSNKLASLDSASACRFSERGICVITKCFSSLVASRTHRTYAAMVSSLASYAPLSLLMTNWELENAWMSLPWQCSIVLFLPHCWML